MSQQKTSKYNRKIRIVVAWLLIWQFALSTVAAQSPLLSKTPSGANDEPKLTAGIADTSKFPSTTVNFTVEKEGSVFRELETKDIEVLFDGKKVELPSNALNKGKENEPLKILFVIDKSLSMTKSADKLGAAKDALNHFISKLDPKDEVAISAFGIDYREDLRLTKVSDSSAINEKIEKLTATDKLTYFYDGVQKAIDQADREKIPNIIFLSDAKDDSDIVIELEKKEDETGLKKEKESREKDLSDKMIKRGMRFFAVAIGDTDTKRSDLAYVDYGTMLNIANPTQGSAEVIKMPEIESLAKDDKEKKKTLIADKLKEQLANIKKALKFSYALVFNLPKTDRTSGDMVLNFKITDGEKAWEQKTPYQYTVKDGIPIFGKAQVQSFMPALANTNSASLRYGDISLIYLLMLVPLGILSLIPMVFNKFAAAAEVKKVNEAIVRLNPGSPFIGTQCPNESGAWGKRFAFNQGDTLIICPQCGTPHHLACWAENKFQCMTRTCESRYQIPAQVLAQNNVQV